MPSSYAPGWFKDAIIYQIFIDRFAGADLKRSKRPIFAGGNIRGIIQKLDYLEDLGVNTLWISPFYKTSAYHGYHITDFFKVDPHFGTLQDIKQLIRDCHKRKMRLIVDFVPNHCSYKHPFFLDAQKRKDSIYRDWFFFKDWPDDYLCFLSFKEIPKINLEHPPAREHILRAAKYWLGLGFDGFRLDHVLGPSHEFWKGFRIEIKKDFPQAALIGEAWMMGIKLKELVTINIRSKYLKWLSGADSDTMLQEYVNELDGVLDFRFQGLVNRYVAKSDDPHRLQILKKRLAAHYKKYPLDYFLPTFLDNHDMDRLMFTCRDDKKRFKQAVELQFSIRQPLIIYYGDEQGLTQQGSMKDIRAHGDLQARQPIDWKNQDEDILGFYKAMIKKRKSKQLS